MPVESDEKYILRGDLMYGWLDNAEIELMKSIKCCLCLSEVTVTELFSCNHKLVYCGCNQFLNTETMKH